MARQRAKFIDFKQKDPRIIYGDCARIFIVFAGLCFMTALLMNCGSRVDHARIATPETVGPVVISKKNTTLKISIEASVKKNSWAFVTGEVLDNDKNYLFAFGKELWKESGFDSDGHWTEAKTNYDMKVTLKEPGSYYFRFLGENGSTNQFLAPADTIIPNVSARIRIEKLAGSSLPHMWLGILALILAIVFNELQSRSVGRFFDSWRDQ